MSRPETMALDRHLAAAAEIVTVKRRMGTSIDQFATIDVRARISGYAGSEVAGAVTVTDSRIIMSALPFDGIAWPGVAGGIRYPVIGDFVVSQGRTRRIEQVERVMTGGEVVRIEGRIR